MAQLRSKRISVQAGLVGCVAQMAWGDSSRESSVIAGVDEQTEHPELQDPELA
jgi:hypothetical protein